MTRKKPPTPAPETWTDPDTGEVLPVIEDPRALDLKRGVAANLTSDELMEDLVTLRGVIEAMASPADRDGIHDFVRAYAERKVFQIVGDLPERTASAPEVAEALRTGQRLGAQAGAAAGYRKGLAEGEERARPKLDPPASFEIVKDAEGKTTQITEMRPGLPVVIKDVARSDDGTVISITARPTSD